jgi:hypothetical protein
VLVDWDRLARERRLIDAQRMRLDQAPVGRYPRAGAEHHKVAGHQLARGDLLRRPAAHDAHHRRRHRLQRGHGLLGTVVLAEPDPRIQRDDHEDHDRLRDVAQRPRQHARGREQRIIGDVS